VGTFELAAVTVAAGIGAPPAASLAVAVLVHIVIIGVTTIGGVLALAGVYLLPTPTMRRNGGVGAAKVVD
jgi:hypothetical protein